MGGPSQLNQQPAAQAFDARQAKGRSKLFVLEPIRLISRPLQRLFASALGIGDLQLNFFAYFVTLAVLFEPGLMTGV